MRKISDQTFTTVNRSDLIPNSTRPCLPRGSGGTPLFLVFLRVPPLALPQDVPGALQDPPQHPLLEPGDQGGHQPHARTERRDKISNMAGEVGAEPTTFL